MDNEMKNIIKKIGVGILAFIFVYMMGYCSAHGDMEKKMNHQTEVINQIKQMVN
jgi:hypothetical protein